MSTLFYPSKPVRWSSIHWKQVEHRISHLQHRITMATEKGEHRKVRNLQRLLIRSLSCRLKAVRQVAQENQGKRSPGIDGEIWTSPDRKLQAAFELRKRTKTKPLRRLYIPKKDGSLRPLGIPTIRDRAHQAVWNMALLPVVEQTSDLFSYGFRPYRSCWDSFAQIRAVFGKKDSAQWVLDADIRKMFDSIDHNWLLKNTPMEQKVLQSWLKSGFFEKDELFPTTSGTPQGGIISPTLANLTLNGLELFLKKRFPVGPRFDSNGKRVSYYRTGIHVIRYADDFLISGKSARQLERIRAAVNEFLSERGLQLHEDKTRIASVYDGFNFLGWKFWKTHKGQFLGQISRDSIRAHKEKIKLAIKKSGNMPVPALIKKLNSLISGWTNYHCCADCLWDVWGEMNAYVYKTLWKWAKKRHGKRSKTWIFSRYWLHRDGRWTFHSVNSTPSKQKLYVLRAYSARKSRIRRLPAAVNVFDLRNRKKIEQTWFLKHRDKLAGTRRAVWTKQAGLCPSCKTPLDVSMPNGVDLHHIIPRSKGGTDKLANLVLLHEHCHYVSHYIDSQKSKK